MARKPKKKGTSGAAVTYISRKQALKRLQLSLKDFRRLCILKGIYPVEPRHKIKPNKGSSTNKTYYYIKDIQFLANEPIIEKFRALKVFIKRLRRAIGKKDREQAARIRNSRPSYKLDNIVKERYPSFTDALRDMDDAISMCFLFSTFPKGRVVTSELIQLCRRLTVEFMHYIIESKSLRKVFISIKGYYFQAEVMGEIVTWVVPHPLGYQHPSDVDFKIMATFTEFYTTMLGFVNYKLYHSLNLYYPPKVVLDVTPEEKEEEKDDDDELQEYVAALNVKLKGTDKTPGEDEVQLDEFPENDETLEDIKKEQEKIKKLQNLFKGKKFFINREVPREYLVFIIRAFGGEVSWDKTLFVGATFQESDETVTHQIVDRPNISRDFTNRFYIQPQWVFDSINARMLLPCQDYFPGVELPAHLSPFVEEKEGDYIPPEKQALLDFQQGVTTGPRMRENESEEEDEFSPSEEESEENQRVEKLNKKNVARKEEDDDDSEESEEDEEEEEYIQPPEKKRSKRQHIENNSSLLPKKAKMVVTKGEVTVENKTKLQEKQAAEEKRLAVLMIPKKKKVLYNKIIYGQKRKVREADKLKTKRQEYDKLKKLEKRFSRKNL